MQEAVQLSCWAQITYSLRRANISRRISALRRASAKKGDQADGGALVKCYRRSGACCSEKPGDVPPPSADCSDLGYSHPALKFLKFGKLFIKPANVSEENGWACLSANTHTHTQH